MTSAVPGDAVRGERVPDGAVPDGAVPDGAVPGGAVPGGAVPGGAGPGDFGPGDFGPGDFGPGGAVPGGAVPGDAVPGGAVPGDVVPGDIAPAVVPLSAGSGVPPSALYDVALLDLDGVVYVGPDAVPGVPEALSAARAAGMALGFVTNNAARTPDEVARHLVEIGVPADPADVITSSQAAAAVLVELLGPGARVLPVGGPGVSAALRAAGLVVVDRAEDRPAAVVQGYGRDVGWAQLAEAVVAVRRGARHVATNTDATIPSPRGPLPGNGAMVGVVSAVTGRQPLVTGKPDPAMHAECVCRTGARRPLVVGDRLDTDIEGARRAGAASLLVLSGVTDPGLLLAASPVRRPDLLSPDAAGLLVPHPAVHLDAAGARCGGWIAQIAEADGILLQAASSSGDSSASVDGPGDGLDGLRALCVAHWSRHPDGAAPARVRAADERGRARLVAWGLAPAQAGKG